jgi:uncharacterized protein YaaN involved in tellurite resistance
MNAVSETINVPTVVADPSAVTRIKSEIDISDRSRIVTFGDRAQRSVVEFADRILAQTQNREIGSTGKLLSDILAKARGLDPATLKDNNFFTRLFSSVESRLRRFTEQFGDVALQIDRICVELDRNKETLRRAIALLDELHEQTKSSLGDLGSHIVAGKSFAEEFRGHKLVELEQAAKAVAPAATRCWQRKPIRMPRRRSTGSRSASSIFSRRARSAFSSCRKSVSFSPATKP